jgi:rubrerythrin
MALAKTFYMLKDAELRTGELYATIGLSMSIAHPGLSDLFNELAEEENVHAQQVEMMRAIFLDSKDAFLENPEAEKTIAEFLQNLDMIKAYFNRHHAQMQPRDLLNLAIDLERHLVDNHSTFFIKIMDESVKKLFANLNSGNEEHIRKLEHYKPG